MGLRGFESEDAEAVGAEFFKELGGDLESALCEQDGPVARAMGMLKSGVNEVVEGGEVRRG